MSLTPQRSKFWKHYIPSDMNDALEKSLEYAKEAENVGVERVALDRMGLKTKWVLYNYIQETGLPARLIRPFERATGINLVTRYLAFANQLILLDIPSGKPASATDIQILQEVSLAAQSSLLRYYSEQCEIHEVLEAIQVNLIELARQRANVRKFQQPELELS